MSLAHFKKSKMAARSKIAAIFPINYVFKWGFLIIEKKLAIFLKENDS